MRATKPLVPAILSLALLAPVVKQSSDEFHGRLDQPVPDVSAAPLPPAHSVAGTASVVFSSFSDTILEDQAYIAPPPATIRTTYTDQSSASVSLSSWVYWDILPRS